MLETRDIIIELFTQEHYKKSIEPEDNLSGLYKDVFLYHWKEEAHHAFLDALEWSRLDSMISPLQREKAIGELIELVGAVDGIMQAQSRSDAEYFLNRCDRALNEVEAGRIKESLLQAYRWQYIFSGVEHPRFQKLFNSITTEDQRKRVNQALEALA